MSYRDGEVRGKVVSLEAVDGGDVNICEVVEELMESDVWAL
jgi:hypothetical protein